uniref:Uncharacterized protein n=1 Tax=Trypanosoma vivax (strain Y486) TaxID=1055687 RepID=G0U424_TRYVY|nr:hypothetical protein TVY486_1012290 [Trypanosoma vivax Y486]
MTARGQANECVCVCVCVCVVIVINVYQLTLFSLSLPAAQIVSGDETGGGRVEATGVAIAISPSLFHNCFLCLDACFFDYSYSFYLEIKNTKPWGKKRQKNKKANRTKYEKGREVCFCVRFLLPFFFLISRRIAFYSADGLVVVAAAAAMLRAWERWILDLIDCGKCSA